MGRKEVLSGYQLAAAQALNASFQTAATTVYNLDNIGINISTTGVTTNTGTFGVQHRIKQSNDVGKQSDWCTLTLDSVPTLANADNVFLINLNQLPPGEVRLTFAPGGGSPNGTAAIWICGCSVGA